VGDIAKPVLHEDIVYSMVIDGDLSKLSNDQVVGYYYHRCELLGLDPGEKPFDLLRLNGKLQLYTTKAGAAALTRVNQLDVKIIDRQNMGGLALITARVTTNNGRSVDDVGAVALENLHGEKLANAWMKAATKAKRRAVLACVGLGILDESELDGVRGAERVSITQLGQPKPEPVDHFMRDIPAKLSAAHARCASIAAAKSTDDKTVTPREVWEAAMRKLSLPPKRDGSMPGLEDLRKSIGFPVCDLIKRWAAKLEVEPEREAGDDDDEESDHEYVDPEWIDDPTAKDAP
jgi:hypothetical protein